MQNIDSVSSLVSQIPLVNFLFMAANTYMMTKVKLAISQLQTEIEKNRKTDSEDMQKWVKEEIRSHTQQVSSFTHVKS